MSPSRFDLQGSGWHKKFLVVSSLEARLARSEVDLS